jgi:hypothetical protein
LDIEEITKSNLIALQEKRLQDFKLPAWQIETDIILQTSLWMTRIDNLVRPKKLDGRELTELKRTGIFTLRDAILAPRIQMAKLLKIVRKELVTVINVLNESHPNLQLESWRPNVKLRDRNGRWLEAAQMTSRKIRNILYDKNNFTTPKIILLSNEDAGRFFQNISRLRNVANKTKMLRLLHNDVYTAERLTRFGMSDSDRCRRCFAKETLNHLLLECPYSMEVFEQLVQRPFDIESAVGVSLSLNALEIRSEILASLVFRMQIMPPIVLVKTSLEKYASGLVNKPSVRQLAERLLSQL